jgi:peptidoglycan/LPS O-acetylase OafA/YrhL
MPTGTWSFAAKGLTYLFTNKADTRSDRGAEVTSPVSGVVDHLDWLDGLRALAALFVFQAHYVGILAPAGGSTWRTSWLLSWTQWGHFAVNLFIVISGYCLMLPVLRKGTLAGGAAGFYRRRARRILPPYFVALVLFVLLGCWRSGRSAAFYLAAQHWHILACVTMMQDWFAQDINPVFWSVAVECHIYLLFPLLLFAWRKIGPFWTIAACFVITEPLSVYLMSTPYLNSCLHYTTLYTFGMLAASLRASPVRSAALWAVCTVPVLAYVTVAGKPVAQQYCEIIDIPLGVGCAALLVLSSDWPPLSRLLSWRPLSFLGSFAYSIYLIHPAFVGEWVLRLGRAEQLALPVGAIGVCYFFHILFERPFMNTRSILRLRSVGRDNDGGGTGVGPSAQ